MSRRQSPLEPPDGIGEPSAQRRRHGAASVLSLLALGAIVIWGLSGYAGGRDLALEARGEAARLQVGWPAYIRTGQIFESTVTVRAERPIGKLVLSLAPQLLRDTTINSIIPEPAMQSQAGGAVRFSYERLAAGETLAVKFDLQINPSMFGQNAGRLAVLDGDREVAAVEIAMRVLP